MFIWMEDDTYFFPVFNAKLINVQALNNSSAVFYCSHIITSLIFRSTKLTLGTDIRNLISAASTFSKSNLFTVKFQNYRLLLDGRDFVQFDLCLFSGS